MSNATAEADTDKQSNNRKQATVGKARRSTRDDQDVGIVIPAYKVAPEPFGEYVRQIRTQVAPAVIRIEADTPAEQLRQQLTQLATQPAVTVAVAHTRRGKGQAITAGFEALQERADILAFADADGSVPVADLTRVIQGVRQTPPTLTVGSRRHPQAVIEQHQTVIRRHLGDLFASVAREVLGLSLYDYQCGVKAVPVSAWRQMREHLYESGFAWDLELLTVADALGVTVREIPITWRDQPGSTVRPAVDIPQLIRGLIMARHRGRYLQGVTSHRLLDQLITAKPPLINRRPASEN